MKIEFRPLSEIRPYDRNPRVNDAAVDAVAASLREFGFRQPLVEYPREEVSVPGPAARHVVARIDDKRGRIVVSRPALR